jgi:hypothetical protein
MEAMRNSWTDERLDDGFDRVTAEIGLVRREVGALRVEVKAEIGSLRSEMKSEVGSLRQENQILLQEMHSLQRTLLQTGGGIVVALLGLLVTQL